MTIAYGIALSMDWDRPYWAGFAVAMISLATIGQSFNKAALRMIGTLMGMVRRTDPHRPVRPGPLAVHTVSLRSGSACAPI